jgi:hypothetical protein
MPYKGRSTGGAENAGWSIVMVGCLSRIGVGDAALAQSAGERVVPTDGCRMSKRAASCWRQSETHGCSGMSQLHWRIAVQWVRHTPEDAEDRYLNVRSTFHVLSPEPTTDGSGWTSRSADSDRSRAISTGGEQKKEKWWRFELLPIKMRGQIRNKISP